MEGDSVTLNTGVKVTQKHRIRWFFNGNRIAEIIGGQSKIYTDVKFTERFIDRLKLDSLTGSLTIMNIRTTDSGEYKLQIIIDSSSFKIFIVNVTAVECLGDRAACCCRSMMLLSLIVAYNQKQRRFVQQQQGAGQNPSVKTLVHLLSAPPAHRLCWRTTSHRLALFVVLDHHQSTALLRTPKTLVGRMSFISRGS
ncbi:uncharacterized protein [Chanodichthys erythropterus]|uniref:uncharacterized protein isoform X2 n=1 Tax=Chanodichthys erythropterus TaxID=933992 RepID=UPI00351E484A